MGLGINRSFAAGELSPALHHRADLSRYASGLAKLRNMIVMRSGGVCNRPGIRWIDPVGADADLLPFVYGDGTTYLVLASNLFPYGSGGTPSASIIEFYKPITTGPGRLLRSGFGTIYQATNAGSVQFNDRIRFVQAGASLFIADSTPSRWLELKRASELNWSLGTLAINPSLPAPTAGSTGASAGTETFIYDVTAVGEDGRESLPTRFTIGPSKARPSPSTRVDLNWATVTGAVRYNVYRQLDVYGFVGISYGNATTNFKDVGVVEDNSAHPPAPRDPQAWNTVGLFQQRLIFAGTDASPGIVSASRVGDFVNYALETPLTDSSSVTFTLASGVVEEVRHVLECSGRLLILTNRGEWTAEGDQDGVVTPTTINLRAWSRHGSSRLPPLSLGSTVLFVTDSGNEVRALSYNAAAGNQQAPDLALFSHHLLDGHTIVSWAYQKTPWHVVWCVRDDGVLLGLTYIPEQEVWGWHRHSVLGGAPVSKVAVLPEYGKDVLYLTINAQLYRMDPDRLGGRSAFYLDGGNTIDLSARTTAWVQLAFTGAGLGGIGETVNWTTATALVITGDYRPVIQVVSSTGALVRVEVTSVLTSTTGTGTLLDALPVGDVGSHRTYAGMRRRYVNLTDSVTGVNNLDGLALAGLGDGAVIPSVTVAAGIADLGGWYEVLSWGVPYTSEMTTLPLDGGQEPVMDRRKLINQVSVSVLESRGFEVAPGDGTDSGTIWAPWESRNNDDDMDAPPPERTELVEVGTMPTWDKNGQVSIRQAQPLPLTVLAVIPSGRVGGN